MKIIKINLPWIKEFSDWEFQDMAPSKRAVLCKHRKKLSKIKESSEESEVVEFELPYKFFDDLKKKENFI